MDKVILLEQIREFADLAHGNQMRKYTPERYMVHPIRVMELCREYDDRIEILAAALLHDVVEDTPITLSQIEIFLKGLLPSPTAKQIRKLVEELTDVYTKADYPHLNRMKRKELENERLKFVSADAQTIKYADIIDNYIDIRKHDPAFSVKFKQEAKILLNNANKGNSQLFLRAKQQLSKDSH